MDHAPGAAGYAECALAFCTHDCYLCTHFHTLRRAILRRKLGGTPHYRPAFSSLLSLLGPLQGTTGLLPFPHRGPELPFCPHGTALSSRPSWSRDLLKLQEGPRAQWAGRVGEGGRFSFLFLWGQVPWARRVTRAGGIWRLPGGRREGSKRVGVHSFTGAAVASGFSPRGRKSEIQAWAAWSPEAPLRGM